MDLLKRMEIEHACKRLNNEYALTIDSGRVNDFLDLFTHTESLWIRGPFATPGSEIEQHRARLTG